MQEHEKIQEVTCEISKRQQTYLDAFNHQDANALAALWISNGIFENLNTQVTVIGRDDLAAYFNEQFQLSGKLQIKIETHSTELKTEDTAVIKGIAQISALDKTEDTYAFRAVFTKENDSWCLQKLSEIRLQRVSSNFVQLHELDWLAGTWVEMDENVEVTSSFKWDKNKNFLLEHFSNKVLGLQEISGYQIIGWDPIRKKIRSWIFDSDGGYGVSFWIQDGNCWYAQTYFTLADGRKSSATHVYTKVDANTYTFSSESRDVDGTILPNIGPYKIIRQKSGK